MKLNLLINPNEMQAFVQQIKTPYGHLNFYFNPIQETEIQCYHVSVIDAYKKMNIIYLKLETNEWQIVQAPDCPSWMLDLGKEFNAAIKENNYTEQANFHFSLHALINQAK